MNNNRILSHGIFPISSGNSTSVWIQWNCTPPSLMVIIYYCTVKSSECASCAHIFSLVSLKSSTNVTPDSLTFSFPLHSFGEFCFFSGYRKKNCASFFRSCWYRRKFIKNHHFKCSTCNCKPAQCLWKMNMNGFCCCCCWFFFVSKASAKWLTLEDYKQVFFCVSDESEKNNNNICFDTEWQQQQKHVLSIYAAVFSVVDCTMKLY